MSEEKIIKHSHNALKILETRNRPLFQKIKDFFEEIAIIVFAVSITLIFHNWNDRRIEREQERNFLEGEKNNLAQAANSLQQSIKDFQPTLNYYSTVLNQIQNNKIDPKFVDKYSGQLTNTLYFTFDDANFEGFKSSGYLRIIRNKYLLRRLITLYSIDIPFQRSMDILLFQKRKQDFDTYIGSRSDMLDGNLQISPLLNDRSVKYQIFTYADWLNERKRHLQALVSEMRSVSEVITKELNQ